MNINYCETATNKKDVLVSFQLVPLLFCMDFLPSGINGKRLARMWVLV
jgi:hypothetical protein